MANKHRGFQAALSLVKVLAAHQSSPYSEED